MMSETQRDEMIDLENVKTELLEVLKPFAEAGRGVMWETTKDYYRFYPVDSYGQPISMGNLRRAMEIYEKMTKGSG